MVTTTKIAQVLPVSTGYLLGLKAEKDGEKQEETATAKTVGSCSARGDGHVPQRSSPRSHRGVWAPRATSLYWEHTTHDDGSSVPTNASGHLHIELRQIEVADCPQLLRQRRIVE